MKSITSLNELKNEVDTSYDKDYEKWINTRYNAILKDLEHLEEIVEEYNDLKCKYDNLENNFKKLKKAIEQIKQLPKCNECDSNWYKGCMCLQKKIKEVLETSKTN